MVLAWVGVRLGLSANVKRALRPQGEESRAQDREETTLLREGTVNTVATKLGVTSCRTLLIAAAAYLALFKGKEKFSREELVSCAKEARAWKSDYTTQTSVNINRMCDAGELVEKSKDVYDLSQKKLAELEQALSE
jgi:predicted transcriptional regulator